MIKDVMVRVDGTADDEPRLAAASSIAQLFDSYLIGLFLNIIPSTFPDQGEITGGLVEMARESGAAIEAALAKSLVSLGRPTEIRRFDVFPDEVASTAVRSARCADVFLSFRSKGETEEEANLAEDILFGAGRHVILIPEGGWPRNALDHIVIGWNGSREAARALSEAIPYLIVAREVTIVVADESPPAEEEAILGADAKEHLHHYGINAILHHTRSLAEGIGATLIAEAQERGAGLIVIGGYSHSPLRERLLGGVTRDLLHRTPVPLLAAH